MGLFRKRKPKEENSFDDVKIKNVDIKKVFGNVVSGNVWTNDSLIKQMPFIMLIVLLSLIYINNRFLYERELKDNSRLIHELNNVKYSSLTLSKDLLDLGRKTGMQEYLKARGSDLEESLKPMVVVD